jgi:nucleoside-diphosphate-sugar epimerase
VLAASEERVEEGAMAVVVTGAAGFIGAHLVRLLAGRGHQVVTIDRRPHAPTGTSAHLVADLPDDDRDGSVTDALRGAEAVFHLAGRAGVRDTSPDRERRRYRDNVLAAERVLGTVPAGVPVVVASSSSVYGGGLHGGRLRPSAEADRLQPQGGYARSKVELERRCWQRAAAGGLVAVARPFTVAGEGQRPDMAIARWLAAARHGQPIRILGSPDRTRDITDVADVAFGLLRMAEGGVMGAVNLGSGVGHRLGDLAATVGAIVGHQPRLVLEPAGPAEPVATLADTRRCRQLLGFVPVTDLTALIARQAAAAPTPVGGPDAALAAAP